MRRGGGGRRAARRAGAWGLLSRGRGGSCGKIVAVSPRIDTRPRTGPKGTEESGPDRGEPGGRRAARMGGASCAHAPT
jgi:hypothetical protein